MQLTSKDNVQDDGGVIKIRGLRTLKAQTTRMPSSKFSSHHGVKPKRVSMLKYGLPLCLAFVITINFSVIWKIETNATRRGDSAKLFALDTFHKIKNARGQEKLPKGKPSEGTSAQIPDKFGELPSAKLLLDMKPPFEDSDIIKLYPAESESKPLKQSANTIVTGYFRIRSKHSSNKYDGWMRNMLSLQDAMVIFTEPALVDQIKKLRSHAIDRTILVPLSGGLDDLPIGKLFSESFWKDQLERDPEKKIHRSYQVFWIWLSKSWFVTQAIRMNMFGSDVFVWSDIGCFRDGKYNSKTMVEHREVIPRHEILQMAHHRPNPPSEKLFNDKYEHKKNFYHSGSQFAGYKDTMVKFHEHFLEIVDRFLEKNMIIVEDQAILQSVCLSYPEICAYAPFTQVKDNHYFGLRHVLHHGDTIDYWRGSSKK